MIQQSGIVQWLVSSKEEKNIKNRKLFIILVTLDYEEFGESDPQQTTANY